MLPNFFFYFTVFFLGLALGSFLNAWIWRTRENIKITTGRSMCPNCRRRLEWYENIPVFSFIFLWGRCRTCKSKIPRHYLFVEMGTALVFVLIAYANLNGTVINWLSFFRDIFFAVLLIFIFVFDLFYQVILSQIVWAGAAGGLIFNLLLGRSFYSMLIGAVVGFGFFVLQYIFSKGRWIGGGDVRMGAMMGVWLGWPYILVALAVAYVSGAIVSLILVILGKKNFASATPFGTYLAVGTMVAMVWGRQIIGWYIGLIK